MLQINERNRVYGEEIHCAIESKNKNYRDWLNDKIQYADLKEGKDFFTKILPSTGGRPKTQYEFTINAIKKICLVERTKKAQLVYKYICELDGIEVLYEPKTRKELLFEININEILQGITKIIPQYQVLNYRIDFYLPEINLAIEYDEKAHESKTISDNKRELEIKKEHKFIKFIRVKEGEENVGLNMILKELFHWAYKKYEHDFDDTNEEMMFLKKFDLSIIKDIGKTLKERTNDYLFRGKEALDSVKELRIENL
jgi:phage anti-repressor protein/very-short-patch-repair endonuclease